MGMLSLGADEIKNEEADERRDEVARRLLNTPPEPRKTKANEKGSTDKPSPKS